MSRPVACLCGALLLALGLSAPLGAALSQPECINPDPAYPICQTILTATGLVFKVTTIVSGDGVGVQVIYGVLGDQWEADVMVCVGDDAAWVSTTSSCDDPPGMLALPTSVAHALAPLLP